MVSSVFSVGSPGQQVERHRGPQRDEPTPRPVYPTAWATRPRSAVPNIGVNRLVVSIAPPQRWLKVSPSRLGKV